MGLSLFLLATQVASIYQVGLGHFCRQPRCLNDYCTLECTVDEVMSDELVGTLRSLWTQMDRLWIRIDDYTL